MTDTLSLAAAAQMLKVSRQAVWQAVQRGTLPAHKEADEWRVSREAVLARQENRPVGGRPPLDPGTGYLSVSQAAVWFGVATSTVYRWVAEDMLRYERRGDSVVIPVDAALAFQRPRRGRPAGTP